MYSLFLHQYFSCSHSLSSADLVLLAWLLKYRICSLPGVFRVFGFRIVMLQYLLEYFPVLILTFIGGGEIQGLCCVIFQNSRFVPGLGIVHCVISFLCSTSDCFFPEAFAALLVISADSHSSSSLTYGTVGFYFFKFRVRLTLYFMVDYLI